MITYPKKILSIEEQIDAYENSGMIVESRDDARSVLSSVGYYRIRGYCFHLYDNTQKKYQPCTKFSDIYKLYQFDIKLSGLIFSMILSTEVALRARLVNALLSKHNDALILMDPAIFSCKKHFWENLSKMSSEISRSNEVFIEHNYAVHNGEIPVWAAVEVLSFGTLSKIINNLKTGKGTACSQLLNEYKITSKRGKKITPSLKMFSSWLHTVTILRNICAHNSRIYNRSINKKPVIMNIDKDSSNLQNTTGLYQMLLALKYLRPSINEWERFYSELSVLFSEYDGVFEFKKMNFPEDWEIHLKL